jgi:ABC-type Fe3+/spermidine/putrescine transport system ATPase subunit
LSISDKVVVMNKGIIEQIGTPEEIYRAPQTRFVAKFIGTANQFMGIASGKDTVNWENITLFTDGAKSFTEGEEVVALVRPENIQILAEQPKRSDWNVIAGVVETITFRGSVTRLGVNVRGQPVSADVTVANSKPVSLNQKVWLVFPPSACQVMAAKE